MADIRMCEVERHFNDLIAEKLIVAHADKKFPAFMQSQDP